jgi:hypothetical protein
VRPHERQVVLLDADRTVRLRRSEHIIVNAHRSTETHK